MSTQPNRTGARRRRLAHDRAARNSCPECQRGAALKIVVNPGTVSTVCRWCDYENTTVL